MKKSLLLSQIAVAVLCASSVSAQQPWDPVPPGGKNTPTQAVPDSGSTLALLGAALMGITAFRRKFLK